jgi:hypothetical protein
MLYCRTEFAKSADLITISYLIIENHVQASTRNLLEPSSTRTNGRATRATADIITAMLISSLYRPFIKKANIVLLKSSLHLKRRL